MVVVVSNSVYSVYGVGFRMGIKFSSYWNLEFYRG